MINDELNDNTNMGRREIFKELPLPSKVEEKGILNLIYKGIFIIVKLLLDIRLNLVKLSSGEKIKTIGNSPRKNYFKDFKHKKNDSSKKPVDNAVIKETDEIKVEDKPVTKVDDSTVEKPVVKEVELTEGKTKTNIKDSKDSTPPVESPDGEEKK